MDSMITYYKKNTCTLHAFKTPLHVNPVKSFNFSKLVNMYIRLITQYSY